MKQQKVKKGVIVVAGAGTRFLPATKTIPKEMLPIADKPVIHYIVEEMIESGITEIIFVTSSNKKAIEDYFDQDKSFDNFLKSRNKYNLIKPLSDLSKRATFFYVRQPEPLGNGHALLFAKGFIGDEPFAFSDGDSVIDAKTPVIKQLVKVFNKKNAPIIGVQKIEDKQAMTKYGNVYAKATKEKSLYKVEKFVEKPDLNKVSEHGLIVGGMRYILTKDIWPLLEKQGEGKGGEIWLADAANALAKKNPFYAYEYNGKYFDTGNKIALLNTTLHFAKKEGWFDQIDILN